MVVLSAPLLYSCSIVSGYIMGGFNEKLGASLPYEVLSQSWIKPGDSPVTVGFLNKYVMVNLLVVSFLGSVIIGEVSSGRARDGLRYMFLMLLVSELLYLMFKTVLMARIGGVFVNI